MTKKRKPYNKSTGRKYKGPNGDYAKFQSSSKAKKDRASRNAARTQAMKAGKVKKGDGKDVHHTKSVRDNTSTKVESASKNRGRAEKSRLKGSGRTMKKPGHKPVDKQGEIVKSGNRMSKLEHEAGQAIMKDAKKKNKKTKGKTKKYASGGKVSHGRKCSMRHKGAATRV